MEFATTTELNQHTNNVLRRVLEDKEDIVLTKNGKPVAMIIPTKKEIAEGKPAKDIFAELKKSRKS